MSERGNRPRQQDSLFVVIRFVKRVLRWLDEAGDPWPWEDERYAR
jgi:hypothetical protein